MPIALPAALRELSCAEEFLDHFGIAYDAERVNVARLHILQRFHEYLSQAEVSADADEETRTQAIGALLGRAYDDFVRSDPLTERVFKVLKDAVQAPPPPPQRAFVPLASLKLVPDRQA